MEVIKTLVMSIFLLVSFVACKNITKSNLTLLNDQIPQIPPWFLDEILFQLSIKNSQSPSVQKWTNYTLHAEKQKRKIRFIP